MRIQHQPARHAENFPVASWFLPQTIRQPVLIFYDYVRGLDDIADDESLPLAQRHAKLGTVIDAVENRNLETLPNWARTYAHAIEKRIIPHRYANQMQRAFLQDTQQTRYANWDALLDYCCHSAAPVGQFLLDQWQETQVDREAVDGLCIALQLLNHLRDLKPDYQTMDRIYLPQDWLKEHGVSETDIASEAMNEGLRSIKARLLDACETRLVHAKDQTNAVQRRRYRYEYTLVVTLALRWLQDLRRGDPLKQRITLSRKSKCIAALKALRSVL